MRDTAPGSGQIDFEQQLTIIPDSNQLTESLQHNVTPRHETPKGTHRPAARNVLQRRTARMETNAHALCRIQVRAVRIQVERTRHRQPRTLHMRPRPCEIADRNAHEIRYGTVRVRHKRPAPTPHETLRRAHRLIINRIAAPRAAIRLRRLRSRAATKCVRRQQRLRVLNLPFTRVTVQDRRERNPRVCRVVAEQRRHNIVLQFNTRPDDLCNGSINIGTDRNELV